MVKPYFNAVVFLVYPKRKKTDMTISSSYFTYILGLYQLLKIFSF